MRKTRAWIVLGFWLVALTVAAFAETRKPGLWEITTTITWQQSPFAGSAADSVAKAGKRTTQVCLTKSMIDDYGALLPQSRGSCHVANKLMTPGGMTADWVCEGRISGTGALSSTWPDLEHSSSTLHFLGTFLMGGDSQPVEWTTQSTAVFKSADCGTVRPKQPPQHPR